MSYNIRGLDHGSVFEAIVQAKNRYGWNEVSDLYQFYTRGAGECCANSRNYSVLAAMVDHTAGAI
jgi:hypothetical protein